MKQRKHFFLCILIILATFNLKAQVGVTPEDDFYIDVTSWMLKGYIDSIPQLKPYPINVISEILLKVCEIGTEADKNKAEFYKKKFFSKPIYVSADSSVNIKSKKVDDGGDKNTDKYENKELFKEKISLFGNIKINKCIGFSYDISGLMRNNNISPSDAKPNFDVNNDSNVARSIYIETSKFDFLLDPNVLFTMGNTKLYATIGINKTGYGLFFDDSLIMNFSTYQSLNTTFNYNGKYFSYSQFFGLLGAQSYLDSDNFTFGKYLSFHSLKIPVPNKNIYFSFYESVVFGRKFMPAYFMPVPYFIIANVAGFNENVLSGLKIEWKPFNDIMFSIDAVLDDFDPKKVLKLKLNDAGIRAGFKTGFVYTPDESKCNFISLDYTLVTPYTYTKYNTADDNYNYLDYTNLGQSMGSNLLPNSDRVSLTISFKPINTFKISTITSLIRHGNAYESLGDDEVCSLSGNYISDGSLNMDTKGLSSAIESTDFLKQDNIMYVIQASLVGEYEFMTSKVGRFNISMQYTFEYIKNDSVDKEIFSGKYLDSVQVNNDRNQWEESLHDSFNHYFTIGVKYSY